MPRKTNPVLTDAELRLMRVIWDVGPSTVEEVRAKLGPPPISYNSVLTTLRILERKGYLRHEKRARAFVYEATVSQTQVRTSALRHLLGKYFGGAADTLAAHLVESENIDINTLEKLREKIEDSER